MRAPRDMFYMRFHSSAGRKIYFVRRTLLCRAAGPLRRADPLPQLSSQDDAFSPTLKSSRWTTGGGAVSDLAVARVRLSDLLAASSPGGGGALVTDLAAAVLLPFDVGDLLAPAFSVRPLVVHIENDTGRAVTFSRPRLEEPLDHGDNAAADAVFADATAVRIEEFASPHFVGLHPVDNDAVVWPPAAAEPAFAFVVSSDVVGTMDENGADLDVAFPPIGVKTGASLQIEAVFRPGRRIPGSKVRAYIHVDVGSGRDAGEGGRPKMQSVVLLLEGSPIGNPYGLDSLFRMIVPRQANITLPLHVTNPHREDLRILSVGPAGDGVSQLRVAISGHGDRSDWDPPPGKRMLTPPSPPAGWTISPGDTSVIVDLELFFRVAGDYTDTLIVRTSHGELRVPMSFSVPDKSLAIYSFPAEVIAGPVTVKALELWTPREHTIFSSSISPVKLFQARSMLQRLDGAADALVSSDPMIPTVLPGRWATVSSTLPALSHNLIQSRDSELGPGLVSTVTRIINSQGPNVPLGIVTKLLPDDVVTLVDGAVLPRFSLIEGGPLAAPEERVLRLKNNFEQPLRVYTVRSLTRGFIARLPSGPLRTVPMGGDLPPITIIMDRMHLLGFPAHQTEPGRSPYLGPSLLITTTAGEAVFDTHPSIHMEDLALVGDGKWERNVDGNGRWRVPEVADDWAPGDGDPVVPYRGTDAPVLLHCAPDFVYLAGKSHPYRDFSVVDFGLVPPGEEREVHCIVSIPGPRSVRVTQLESSSEKHVTVSAKMPIKRSNLRPDILKPDRNNDFPALTPLASQKVTLRLVNTDYPVAEDRDGDGFQVKYGEAKFSVSWEDARMFPEPGAPLRGVEEFAVRWQTAEGTLALSAPGLMPGGQVYVSTLPGDIGSIILTASNTYGIDLSLISAHVSGSMIDVRIAGGRSAVCPACDGNPLIVPAGAENVFLAEIFVQPGDRNAIKAKNPVRGVTDPDWISGGGELDEPFGWHDAVELHRRREFFRLRNEAVLRGARDIWPEVSFRFDHHVTAQIAVKIDILWPRIATSTLLDFGDVTVGSTSEQWLKVVNPAEIPIEVALGAAVLGPSSEVGGFLPVNPSAPGTGVLAAEAAVRDPRGPGVFELPPGAVARVNIAPKRTALLGPVRFSPRNPSQLLEGHVWVRSTLAHSEVVTLRGAALPGPDIALEVMLDCAEFRAVADGDRCVHPGFLGRTVSALWTPQLAHRLVLPSDHARVTPCAAVGPGGTCVAVAKANGTTLNEGNKTAASPIVGWRGLQAEWIVAAVPIDEEVWDVDTVVALVDERGEPTCWMDGLTLGAPACVDGVPAVQPPGRGRYEFVITLVSDDPSVVNIRDGILLPRRDRVATLQVKVGGRSAQLEVAVSPDVVDPVQPDNARETRVHRRWILVLAGLSVVCAGLIWLQADRQAMAADREQTCAAVGVDGLPRSGNGVLSTSTGLLEQEKTTTASSTQSTSITATDRRRSLPAIEGGDRAPRRHNSDKDSAVRGGGAAAAADASPVSPPPPRRAATEKAIKTSTVEEKEAAIPKQAPAAAAAARLASGAGRNGAKAPLTPVSTSITAASSAAAAAEATPRRTTPALSASSKDAGSGRVRRAEGHKCDPASPPPPGYAPETKRRTIGAPRDRALSVAAPTPATARKAVNAAPAGPTAARAPLRSAPARAAVSQPTAAVAAASLAPPRRGLPVLEQSLAGNGADANNVVSGGPSAAEAWREARLVSSSPAVPPSDAHAVTAAAAIVAATTAASPTPDHPALATATVPRPPSPTPPPRPPPVEVPPVSSVRGHSVADGRTSVSPVPDGVMIPGLFGLSPGGVLPPGPPPGVGLRSHAFWGPIGPSAEGINTGNPRQGVSSFPHHTGEGVNYFDTFFASLGGIGGGFMGGGPMAGGPVGGGPMGGPVGTAMRGSVPGAEASGGPGPAPGAGAIGAMAGGPFLGAALGGWDHPAAPMLPPLETSPPAHPETEEASRPETLSRRPDSPGGAGGDVDVSGAADGSLPDLGQQARELAGALGVDLAHLKRAVSKRAEELSCAGIMDQARIEDDLADLVESILAKGENKRH